MTAGRPGSRELSTLRVTWLVSRLSLKRLQNRFSSLRRRKPRPGQRAATPRKSAAGKALLGAFGLLLGIQVVTLMSMFVAQNARALERREHPGVVFVQSDTYSELEIAAGDGACSESDFGSTWRLDRVFAEETYLIRDGAERAERKAALGRVFQERCLSGFRASEVELGVWPSPELWYEADDALAMPRTLALASILLALAVTLQTIAGAGRDLTDVDARFEWLFSFPVRARSLFLARVLAGGLTGPMTWVMVFPFYGTIFYSAGFGVASLPLAAASALYIGGLASAARVLAETLLPRLLSPANVARVQSFVMLAGYLAMLATFVLAYSPHTGRLAEAAPDLPPWTAYGPGSLPVLISAGGGPALVAGGAALALLIAVVAAVVRSCEHLVAAGVVATTGERQGRRGEAAVVPAKGGLLRGVAAKELRALFRDRQLRMQAFVTPAVLVGLQLWLNPSLLTSLGENPRYLAAAAFGTAMFPLATGACTGLATEGQALWMLYTAPVGLARLLLAKVVVWTAVAMTFAGLVFIGMWSQHPALIVPSLPYVPVIAMGVPLYAVIALGIGALGTDPLEDEPRKRVRPGAVYLFMTLAAFYGYSLYSPSLWAKLVELVLSALLAYAVWQKLRDHMPYLLDPTEAPPASISVSDGVLAAIGFFVFQGVYLALVHEGGAIATHELFAAFGLAGISVSAVAVLILWWNKVPDLPRVLGILPPSGSRAGSAIAALVVGALSGVVAGLVSMAYRAVVLRIPALRELVESQSTSQADLNHGSLIWFVLVAVVLAPLFEELIFRGILYRGFRRSLRAPLAALASALVFALVHPAISALPVFAMAYLAAVVYERFRWLAAPIATHVVYNAVVVGTTLLVS